MAPTPYLLPATSEYTEEPISRTYQYRKVMKPMLERKRRARINRCLDELKELMVTALQNEGENVSKLEKADILELTVRHLHSLKRQHQLILAAPEQSYADKFRAGFSQCAQEVSQFLTAPPLQECEDRTSGKRLLQHLGACVRQMDVATPPPSARYSQYSTPPASPEAQKSMWRPW
ncbi:enhancer of split mbeta protein-like [Harmonia axyridis]|uniref:enhancer of split mbeta protein-like n=1 Tax=Harmonia axyridis TaxID=115357 RepID=UPI001E27781F|nr:enhancer of split mbeta protein-like [Harmonia axyridis]